MPKKFSLKIYKNYKLIHYLPENSYNQETNEHEYIPDSSEYCLTYKEFIFNIEIDKPIFEVKDGFENIHKLYKRKNFASDRVKRDNFLLEKNNQQADIANFRLTYWEKKKKAFPQSLTIQRRIQYLHTVLTEIDTWLEYKNIIPSPSSKPSRRKTILSNQSKITKSLAAFMRELLKNKEAKKYLMTTESMENKKDYVVKAILNSIWNVSYTSSTIKRYLKPKKILEFLPKKK